MRSRGSTPLSEPTPAQRYRSPLKKPAIVRKRQYTTEEVASRDQDDVTTVWALEHDWPGPIRPPTERDVEILTAWWKKGTVVAAAKELSLSTQTRQERPSDPSPACERRVE